MPLRPSVIKPVTLSKALSQFDQLLSSSPSQTRASLHSKAGTLLEETQRPRSTATLPGNQPSAVETTSTREQVESEPSKNPDIRLGSSDDGDVGSSQALVTLVNAEQGPGKATMMLLKRNGPQSYEATPIQMATPVTGVQTSSGDNPSEIVAELGPDILGGAGCGNMQPVVESTQPVRPPFAVAYPGTEPR